MSNAKSNPIDIKGCSCSKDCNESASEYNKWMESVYCSLGYDGPREFDLDGKILSPTWEDSIIEQRRVKKGMHQHALKNNKFLAKGRRV